MEEEADFFRIAPSGFDQIEDADENGLRPIPIGFDPNAIEINRSTYNIDGDLSIAGNYFPTQGIGNSKAQSFFFPAQVIINRISSVADSKFTDVYGTNNRPITSWAMLPSASTQRYLSVGFGIPATLDTTVNPTVDLYIAVSILAQPAGRTANFAVDVDYANSGDIIGISSPATGFDQTVTTGNLSITEPTGANNLKIYKVSVTLNGALITPGSLCDLYFSRVAPTAGTEYALNVYLVAANFNFSVT